MSGPGNAATPLAPPTSALRRAEQRAADAVGALLELWGFKRQMGRVWTVLFLSERPLTAAEACERLGISTGLLSMTLAELRAWGAVRTVTVPGERRERYEAEVQVWRMVLRVLGSRERGALDEALRAFEGALEEARVVDRGRRPGGPRGGPLPGRAARPARGPHPRRGGLLRILTEAIAGRRRG